MFSQCVSSFPSQITSSFTLGGAVIALAGWLWDNGVAILWDNLSQMILDS